MRASRTAFTLVELLVVISIVAVLVAVLLPAISRAKKEARFVLCQSQIRQMGLSLLLYETDARSYPPSAGATAGPNNAILAYSSGNKTVWYCPDREYYTGFRYNTPDWPTIGYYYYGGLFPRGNKLQYDGAFTVNPTWYFAYYPLVQDELIWGTTRVTGYGFFVDRETGECNDRYNRFAHLNSSYLLDRSNAMRHDGSVSSQKYAYARRYDNGQIYSWNAPGTINPNGNYGIHVVDPTPFALKITGPLTYIPPQFYVR